MNSPIEYNSAWSKTRLRSPEIWYTWRILQPYMKGAQRRLEIGAGMLPKFSVQDTYFLDTSAYAIAQLNTKGGKGIVLGTQEQFPFQEQFFDLVGAFEVLEHIEQPERAVQNVARALKPGGLFILSVPTDPAHWSSWDVFAGHVQRFEKKHLTEILEKEGFRVEHCYVSRKLAHKRFFSWIIHAASFLPLHFPNFFFFFYKYLILPYAWFGRTFSHATHYLSLQEIPQDSTSVLVVCRKQRDYPHIHNMGSGD